MHLNEYHKKRIEELRKLAEKEKDRKLSLEEVRSQFKRIREGRNYNPNKK